jgi:DNA-binding GntR family transcriptional regulator
VFPRLYRGQPHRRGEHRRVVDAIAAHDGRAAGEAMTAHLRQALADTLHHVETSEGRAPAEPASSS